MVLVQLSPDNPKDYQTFLKIKQLPQYRFVGRTAEIPQEYAAMIGVGRKQGRRSAYKPSAGLFDYQEDISRLAIAKRKFAAFVRPGLGKTFIESEFARHAAEQLPADRKVLMVAPPMVIPQTLEEIGRFYKGGLPVETVTAANLSDWLTRSSGCRIGITNYEALRDDTPQGLLGALILDESSVLKSFGGTWGQICIRLGRGLEWKLCGTGTPAPNDRIEFANHAVFLDHFPTVNSFLARFFINRGQTQNRWELKPHALRPFYRALSHWCIFLNNPGAYGWKSNAEPLPPIHVHIHDVPMSDQQRQLAGDLTGTMFGVAGGIASRSKLSQVAKGHYKGEEIETHKPAYIRDLIGGWPDESTLVWCLYNKEQDAIERALPGCLSMRGETKYADRVEMLRQFKSGEKRVLVSKPDILGFGLNLQIATRQVFSGLQDSYESYYQCVMRSNRVGSSKPLNVHIPVTLIERPMVDTVLTKAKRVEADAAEQEQMFLDSGLLQEVRHVA